MRKRLAIIPARGGSKRIPKKNIKPFLGKPIIAYPIEVLLSCNLFDKVVVSTDSQEIAKIAMDLGASVPWLRSDSNSTDIAGTWPVIDEVIRNYEAENIEFDTVCCVYPTSVFLTNELIEKAIGLLEQEQLTSVVAITEFSHPIQRAIQIREDKLYFKEPENRLTRTQDLERFYHDTGQLYVLNPEKMRGQSGLFTDNTGFVQVLERVVQDIDNPEDWSLAELKFKAWKETSNSR